MFFSLVDSMVLGTDRNGLTLRRLAGGRDDVAYFEAQSESPEHIAAFGNTVDETLAEVAEARLNTFGKVLLGIWDGDRLVGKASIHPHGNGEMEVGYWLRPSALGHGYATIAVRSMTAYLKPTSSRVFAEVRVDNESSIRVMERSGYSRVEVIDRNWGRVI